jgi:hypothetical protein
MATAFWQASIVPFVVSSGVSFESQVRTLIWRQPTPPLALTVLAQACTPSIEPWNNPGASGEPTSAITSIVMSFGVMPTSVACKGSLAHFAAMSAAVVSVAPPVSAVVVSVAPLAVVAVVVAVVAAAAAVVLSPPELLLSSRPHAAAAATNRMTSDSRRTRCIWTPGQACAPPPVAHVARQPRQTSGTIVKSGGRQIRRVRGSGRGRRGGSRR